MANLSKPNYDTVTHWVPNRHFPGWEVYFSRKSNKWVVVDLESDSVDRFDSLSLWLADDDNDPSSLLSQVQNNTELVASHDDNACEVVISCDDCPHGWNRIWSTRDNKSGETHNGRPVLDNSELDPMSCMICSETHDYYGTIMSFVENDGDIVCLECSDDS